MDEKQVGLLTNRVDLFMGRVRNLTLAESVPLEATFCWSKDPVPFDKRLEGEYRPIKQGEQWGRDWESAWFHIRGTVPEQWRGKCVVAHLDFTGEALIVSNDGLPLQGITSGSAFSKNFNRHLFRLHDVCEGGEPVEIWLEAAANDLFGMNKPSEYMPGSPDRYGHYDARVTHLELAVFDTDVWSLLLDTEVLFQLMKRLPETSVRRARILRTLNEAVDAFRDNRANAPRSREILSRELSKHAAPSDLTATAVGHAHLDTGWLWPVRESIRKCARTFSTQINLMERYPDYVFGASQPQHYAFVKKHYPALYEKIRHYVKEGRWEVQGGMWVEADCNLTSGESLVRQILHGKNFFRDEFGVDVKNLWLPDVFGYSFAMPQILRKSGIDYFLTQKISWNQYNHFPHHTFKWRGLDGSEVLTHFPPEDDYGSTLSHDKLANAQEHFIERDFIDEFLVLFGIGDGGGGPKEDHIEKGLRAANLEGVPRIKFGTAADFFERLSKYEDQVETWVGELYFEMHRGTLTSQALTKKGNRRLELKLREVEFLCSCLPFAAYPAADLDATWKTVLLNQFHDILPGSSIKKVYDVTHVEHREALAKCDELAAAAAGQLFAKDSDSLVLFNSLSTPYTSPVVLPEGWRGCSVVDEAGSAVAAQQEEAGTVVIADVPALSFMTLKKSGSAKAAKPAAPGTDLVLENDLVRYEFDANAALVRAFDKETSHEVLAPGCSGNLLTFYLDPTNRGLDAWDFFLDYERDVIGYAQGVECQRISDGPVRQGLRFQLRVGQSDITQTITLGARSKRLDFATTVDWRERHRMLRVSFPANVQNERASFDIQYGFIERATHRNTSWDLAKFEVAGQRYMDLSCRDYGLAVLNDCKYGHKVLDNVLDLNLLRATTYPDPDADEGIHSFTYSLLPHAGSLIESNVIAEAAQLNQGVALFDGCRANALALPCRLEGEGLSLEVLKKAEKEDCLVVRIVEVLGRHSKGRLIVADPKKSLVETDLMEWTDGEATSCNGPVEICLKPFEIRTYKVR